MRVRPFAVALMTAALTRATLMSCKPSSPPADGAQPPAADAGASSTQADAAFAALSKRFLDEGLALNPVSATQIGEHRYDSEIDDLSEVGRNKAVAWNKALLAELG